MSDLTEILENLDFESYLDAVGVEYRLRPGSSGRQLNIKSCPSCGDNSWKVYAGEATGLGNCFKGSCELGTFNKWKFIKAYLGNPGNGDVVRHITEIAGSLGWRPKRTSCAVEYSAEVVLPQSFPLPAENGSNLAYLEQRNVKPELTQFFHLRYCHSGGYKQGERSQDYSGRVIIPVFDLEGTLRTFQGRDISGAKDPKYLFPPGLSASGRFLYNGQNAWMSDHVVVGEGAFDVIAIHAALQEDPSLRSVAAVGTFGMHLSANADGEDQLSAFIALMGQRLKKVTLMWDSEPAALRGALAASDKLRGIGLQTQIAILPKGKDPNEVHPIVIREALHAAADPSTADGYRRVLKAIMF